MIHKVFHHTSSMFAHHRCVDRIGRILCTSFRQEVFTTRHPILLTCCYSDFCKHSYVKEKPKRISVSDISLNNCPQIISKQYFSSKENEKQKSVNNEEESSKKQNGTSTVKPCDDKKKLSIFQRFKEMYRDYWYVLVPVHVVTSIGWFGGFYYAAKSGVDIVKIVEILGVSDHIPDVLKDSGAGYLAVTYALYKIATPLRYMVTIGGTTVSIKYLKEYGYIKPIPPKEKLKEMYQERKENLKERRQHLADEIKQKREKLKERRRTLMRGQQQQTEK